MCPSLSYNSGKFAGIVYAQAIDTPAVADSPDQKVATGAGLAACIPASAIPGS